MLAEVRSEIKSAGTFPLLSFKSLGAPLINKALTGLVLLRVSTDLTAKCKGVRPSQS